MGDGWLIVWILAVIFFATLIRSAFGFGEALIAVPLLALRMPVEVAAPLAVLVSITVALAIILEDWHKVHLGSAWRLVLSTLFGIPLGLLLLTALPGPIVKGALAVVIIAFSGYCLARRAPLELNDDRLAWLFGFSAGVLGGAYGMNGPPLVIYGALRRWSAEHFRATLQGYFLPASVVGMAGYWLTGLWVPAVTRYYLLSLPVAVASIVLGRLVNRRLAGRSFIRYVHVALVLIGVALLVQSVGSREGQHQAEPGLREGGHQEGRGPEKSTPDRTRTCNLRFRRPMLYPIELLVHRSTLTKVIIGNRWGTVNLPSGLLCPGKPAGLLWPCGRPWARPGGKLLAGICHRAGERE